MRRLLTLCTVLLVAAAPASAQDPLAALEPGTRVRITAVGMETRRVVGQVAAVTRDSLRIYRAVSAGPLELSRSSLIAVERSRGKSRWAGRGALWGAGVGTALGIVCLAACPVPENSGANFAPVGGLLYGTLIGAIGGTLTRREQWTRIPMPRRKGD